MTSQKKAVVFFDTNAVNSDSLVQLFGFRKELTELSEHAEICIPEIVLDELANHKQKNFKRSVGFLKNNTLVSYFSLNREEISELRFETIFEKLQALETIEHTVCQISNPAAAFHEACRLAVSNLPPFDAGSDKGFKDACVALTVKDYLKSEERRETVYLVTNDSRLREHFDGNDEVTVVATIPEAIELVTREDLQTQEEDADTSDSGLTSDEAQIEKTHSDLDDEAYSDSSPSENEVETLITRLCESESFQQTHSIVAVLEPQSRLIDASMATRLLRASLENTQISWILSDEDVRGLFIDLFERYQHALDDGDYAAFVDLADLPNDRLDSMGNVVFSKSERGAYLSFVDELVSNIASREFTSVIRDDMTSIIAELKEQLCRTTLDPSSTSWYTLTAVFIRGSFEAATSSVDTASLERFVRFLEQCNDEKRQAVMNAIASRLNTIKTTFDLPF